MPSTVSVQDHDFEMLQATTSRKPLAEFHGTDPGELDASLWDIFSRTATNYPEREAIVSMWQRPSRPAALWPISSNVDHKLCLRWTYEDLRERADVAAASLSALGCRRGMILVAMLWNSAEWGLLFWATAKLGITFVPIDPRSPEEAKAASCIKPDIVIVQDASDAALFDETWGRHKAPTLYIQCSEKSTPGWSALQDVLPVDVQGLHISSADFPEQKLPNGNGEQPALIVFTSGTTGIPKACPHSTVNLLSQTCDFDPNVDHTVIDRWLVHTPVSHIFAVNNALRSWRYGGAVVFPSKNFDVEMTAKALLQEKCTFMAATPTLVRALLSHPKCPKPQETTLNLITIAATNITYQDIQACRDGLGSVHTIQAYGMSEGAPLISWVRSDKLLKDGNSYIGVGKVLPGASVRICHPKTRQVVGINQVGELHVGGTSVISRYLKPLSDTPFYQSGAMNWFATGDQAVIDANGVVQILGRYKDLIIRGGENLNPGKIENVLMALPGIQAWVVGAPDQLAGEIPIAVVQLSPGVSKAQIYDQAGSLGTKYALGGVYTLKELGLDNVPITALGKVKKEVLKGAILKLYEQQGSELSSDESRESWSIDGSSKSSVTQLIDVWETVTGVRPSSSDNMCHVADSITLLRYCDAVFRSCGKHLYLRDVVQHDTIAQQAVLLEERERSDRRTVQPQPQLAKAEGQIICRKSPNMGKSAGKSRSNPPLPAYLPPWQQRLQPARWERLRLEAVAQSRRFYLKDALVQDIIPIRESLHRMVKGQRQQSFHVRMVFQVHDVGAYQIRQGLEKALLSRPLLRAMVLEAASGPLHHVVLGTSHDLFERLISARSYGSWEEAKAMWEDDREVEGCSPFMFHAEIMSVRGSEEKFISMLFNHSAMDALSLFPWHVDLDRLIDNINADVPEPTPFRLFSDLFNENHRGLPASEAVNFHVNHLRGISRLKRALWPPQRAPGWMISCDLNTVYSFERDAIRDKVWNGEWKLRAAEFRYPRLARIVCLPHLRKLKDRGIEPCLFAKAAIVVFNVLKTGASHAIFNTWESGRSWPFVPQWTEGLLPPASSIDGPTVAWLLNLIEVLDYETVLDFLQRVASEASEMKKHEHVPWRKLVKELRDEGHVAIDASFRQAFVWDLSLGLSSIRSNRGNFKCLEPVARFDWADCGFFWNAFMIDRDNLYFIASWDTAQLNDVEVDGCCDLLADVMRKLGDEKNWEKKVGDVFVLGRGR